MSKFFNVSSSEEEESDQEFETKPSEQKIPAKFGKGKAPAKTIVSSDDESSEEEKRVVKSQKDKRIEGLYSSIENLNSLVKNNDWNGALDEYDNLSKQLQKAMAIFQKEGKGVPEEYISTVITLDETIKTTINNKVKLSPTNTKSLKSLMQKVRKTLKQYENEVSEYKKKNTAAPAKSKEEPEEEEEEEEDKKPTKGAKPAAKPAAKKAAAKKVAKEIEDDEEEEESEDESEDDKADAKGPNKWLKKSKEPKEAAKTPVKAVKKPKDKRKTSKAASATTEKAATSGETEAFTKEDIDAQLEEIISSRGKKGIDRPKQIERLSALSKQAKTPEQEVGILLHLISAQFDNVSSTATHIPSALWRSTNQNVARVLELLGKSISDKNGEIASSVVGFVERLDDELVRSFQNIDYHTQDYVERLQDENVLIDLSEKVFKHLNKLPLAKQKQGQLLARIAIRRLDHLYYKRDENQLPLISKLALIVYAQGDERLKTRAALSQIYNWALHDKFYEARDMMLMSHLQESVATADVNTMVLFNRAMVQLGLCAFRLGHISEAHSCLTDICQGNRVKELLAQGLVPPRYGEKSADQEKAEKRRQIPYHLHINLELLEVVHLVSAMLLEVPNMAANAFDINRKKMISRPYRRLTEYYDRQVFIGPPENTRDYIFAAGKALSQGNWKRTVELVLSFNAWNLIPNADQVKTILKRKIQEEGLRTHLFAFSSLYDSMSLQELGDIFELPTNVVHSLISKMVMNEELHASWDQPTGSIIMHRVEPTRLQALSLQLAEKATQLVEQNEKQLDTRTGGYGYKTDKAAGAKGERGRGRGRGGYNRSQNQEDGERRESSGRGGRNTRDNRGGDRGGRGGRGRGGNQQRS